MPNISKLIFSSILLISNSSAYSGQEQNIGRELLHMFNQAYIESKPELILSKFNPDTISCWPSETHNFLLNRIVSYPYSESAKVKIEVADDELLSKYIPAGLGTMVVKPTHVLHISEQVYYPSHCDKGEYAGERSTRELLRIENGKFELINACPTPELIKRIKEKGERLILTKKNVDTVYEQLGEKKRVDIIENIGGSNSRIKGLKRIVDDYNASLKLAMMVLDKVCRK